MCGLTTRESLAIHLLLLSALVSISGDRAVSAPSSSYMCSHSLSIEYKNLPSQVSPCYVIPPLPPRHCLKSSSKSSPTQSSPMEAPSPIHSPSPSQAPSPRRPKSCRASTMTGLDGSNRSTVASNGLRLARLAVTWVLLASSEGLLRFKSCTLHASRISAS